MLIRPESNSRPPAWQPGAQPTEPPEKALWTNYKGCSSNLTDQPVCQYRCFFALLAFQDKLFSLLWMKHCVSLMTVRRPVLLLKVRQTCWWSLTDSLRRTADFVNPATIRREWYDLLFFTTSVLIYDLWRPPITLLSQSDAYIFPRKASAVRATWRCDWLVWLSVIDWSNWIGSRLRLVQTRELARILRVKYKI